jgi:hypothetical protein
LRLHEGRVEVGRARKGLSVSRAPVPDPPGRPLGEIEVGNRSIRTLTLFSCELIDLGAARWNRCTQARRVATEPQKKLILAPTPKSALA